MQRVHKFIFWWHEYKGAIWLTLGFKRWAAASFKKATYHGLKGKVLMVNPEFARDRTGTKPMLIKRPK